MRKSKRYTGVYLHELSNGDITYYIQYINEDRLNTKIKIGRKSQGINENYCFNKRNELIHQVRLGENPFKKNNIPTFDEIANKYFEHLILNGRSIENTNYSKRRYEMYIKPFLSKKLISNISVDILNKIKKNKIKSLAPRTVNELLSLISIIINFANRFHNLKVDNPVQQRRITKLKEDGGRERFLSKEEIDILLDAVSNYTQVNKAVRFAISTGARLGTILSIKVKDIDTNNRTVNLIDHKNNSTFISYLHEKFFPNFDFLNGLNQHDYIFTYKGKKIEGASVQLQFRTIANNLFNEGLDKNDRKNRVVFHTLRHTYCSQLCMAGVPIYTVQKLVNHKSIVSTIRYSKLTHKSMFEEVKKAF